MEGSSGPHRFPGLARSKQLGTQSAARCRSPRDAAAYRRRIRETNRAEPLRHRAAARRIVDRRFAPAAGELQPGKCVVELAGRQSAGPLEISAASGNSSRRPVGSMSFSSHRVANRQFDDAAVRLPPPSGTRKYGCVPNPHGSGASHGFSIRYSARSEVASDRVRRRQAKIGRPAVLQRRIVAPGMKLADDAASPTARSLATAATGQSHESHCQTHRPARVHIACLPS